MRGAPSALGLMSDKARGEGMYENRNSPVGALEPERQPETHSFSVQRLGVLIDTARPSALTGVIASGR